MQNPFSRNPAIGKATVRLLMVVPVIFALSACTQESQNKIGRTVKNWTGTNGVLDVYAGEKLVNRFIGIDKLSTAGATGTSAEARPYRYGYGVLDLNQNYIADKDEKKLYFEISDYSTSYVFYENPLM